MDDAAAVVAPGRLAGTAVAATLLVYAAFPHRWEYPAHIAAGAGLAALVLALADPLLARWRRGDGQALRVIVAAGAVVLGAGVAELTVAGPPALHDVANTALGGLLAVAAVVPALPSGPMAPPTRRRLLAVGVALLAVGWALRYPVQDLTRVEWWYGA